MSSNDPTRGPLIIITIWILAGIAITAVLVRLYSRIVVIRKPGWDDLFIALALASSISVNVGDTIAVRHGYGRHESDLDSEQLAVAKKFVYIDFMNNFACLFLMRTSIMIFVLRLLPKTKKWQFHLIYFALFLNVAITVVALALTGVRCIPSDGVDTEHHTATCINSNFLTVSRILNASLACVIDFITAGIPMLLLYDLQIKRSTKNLMYLALFLGLLTAALSIARAVTIVHPNTQVDLTWNQVPCCLVAHYEEKLGITIACLPGIRQLVITLGRNRTKGSQTNKCVSRPGSIITTESGPKIHLIENLKTTVGFRESQHLQHTRKSQASALSRGVPLEALDSKTGHLKQSESRFALQDPRAMSQMARPDDFLDTSASVQAGRTSDEEWEVGSSEPH